MEQKSNRSFNIFLAVVIGVMLLTLILTLTTSRMQELNPVKKEKVSHY